MVYLYIVFCLFVSIHILLLLMNVMIEVSQRITTDFIGNYPISLVGLINQLYQF